MDDPEQGARSVLFPPAVLRAKFKHAAAFGIAGPYSLAAASEFEGRLRQHVFAEETVVIRGTFRGKMAVDMYVNAETELIVIATTGGRFVSAWRLSPTQLRNVLERGRL